MSNVTKSSGVAIVELDGSATPQNIPRAAGWTVVVVTPVSQTQGDLTLPADAEIGDVVEVHVLLVGIFNVSVDVIAPAGESNDDTTVNRLWGRLFRKVAATRWVAVGTPST